jgi:hypothetical protein
MSCERFREALSRHAAGDGIDGAAAAHLEGCRACAARLDLQRRLLSEVDGELERALTIDASPELVARVIARSRGARDAAWRVRAAWAGLAAAAALAVGVYLRAPVDAPSPAPASVRQSSASPESSNAGGVQASAAPKSAPTAAAAGSARGSVTSGSADRRVTAPDRHRQLQAPRAAAKSPAEPDVLVQPDQARAIARLRELLTQGRLTEQMLPPVHPHEAAELSVAPLRIADIAVPDVDSAGHTDAVSRERQ